MDADYVNNIKDVCGIIHIRSYKEFCTTGVAYETRLGSYNCPNRTLSSYFEGRCPKTGDSIAARGFWGDIINSPYYAFGIETHPKDSARLFKRSQDQYRHSQFDLTEFNLRAYLHALAYEQEYHLPSEKPSEHEFPFSSPMDDVRLAIEEEDEAKGALLKGFKDVKISLICGDLVDTIRKPKYRNKFHRGFVGSLASLSLIGSDEKRREHFKEAFAEDACISFETLLHQAHFDSKVKLAFRETLVGSAKNVGWSLLGEKRKVAPKLDHDMSEMNAKKAEQNAPAFLHFTTTPSENDE